MLIKSILLSLITMMITIFSNFAYGFDPKSKPITVVIPFAPGGGVDLTFRNLQKYAAGKGINMVAVYKPGAEGVIGKRTLADMPADGFHVSVSTIAVVSTYRLSNITKDVLPITSIRDSIMVFVTQSNNKINSFDDVVDKVKEGQKITFGYGAPGQKMFLDQFFSFVNPKKDPLLVPYKGGGPVVTDLLGGHIDVAAVPLSIVKSHIDSGKLKLLASDEDIRTPNVVLLKSRYQSWEKQDGFVFVVQSGTPQEAIQFWTTFLNEYLNHSDVKKSFEEEFTISSKFGNNHAELMIGNYIKHLTKSNK
jgi:tripartite-type tricarboxylate transporter receptor subunit TctC